MDGPSRGQNGHTDFPHDFQFTQQPPTQLQYTDSANGHIPPLRMSFWDSAHIGTSSGQFAMPAIGEAQGMSGTAFMTNNDMSQWQGAGAGSELETASNASAVARLATEVRQLYTTSESRYQPSESRYTHSEAGSVHRRQTKAKRRHNSRTSNAVATTSTAGPGSVNDMRSTGAPSEQGEIDLAAHSIELGDGLFQCIICNEKKKPKCDMLKHINMHIRPYRCNNSSCRKAGRGFSTKNDLVRHERTHKDPKTLSQVYICSHDKCRVKSKPWPRWDNLKTHLRDVHSVENPAKGDYHKENPAAQNQMLAGITGQLGLETATTSPPDAMQTDEDLSTADLMPTGIQNPSNSSLQFLTQSDSMQALEDFNQRFGGAGGTLQRRSNFGNGQSMQHLRNLNATTTAVGYPNFNSSLITQPPLGVNYRHGPSNYSTNFTGLQQSATGSFSNQLLSHTHMHPDMSYLASPSRRGPRSQGQAPPLSPHQTTHSLRSYNSFNNMPFSHAGNNSSSPTFAATSLHPTGETHTTSMAVNAVEHPVDESLEDFVMGDAKSEAGGDTSFGTADYDLAGTPGVDAGTSAVPGSHFRSDNNSENDGVTTTEAVWPDTKDSLHASFINDESGAPDTDSIDDIHREQKELVNFVSPQSLKVVNPLETVLSSTFDSGTIYRTSEIEAPEAATTNPTLAPTLADVIKFVNKCSKEDFKMLSKAFSEAPAHQEAEVKIDTRPPAESRADPQSVAPKTPSVSKEEESESKTFKCLSFGCDKAFNSSSGLKKHEVRHKRPFGCTYRCLSNGKLQTFGSKNDWKRHEESVHFGVEKPYMRWQCDGKKADKTECHEVFATSASFQEHLNQKHDGLMTSKKAAQEKLNKCCLITVDEAEFWCGFCKKTLNDKADSSTSIAFAATTSSGCAIDDPAMPPNTVHYSRLLSSRFNHIDNHFSGRNYEAVTVESWVSQDEHKKATSAPQSAALAPRHNRGLAHARRTRDNRLSPKYLRDRPKSVTDYHWVCCRCGQSSSKFDMYCSECSAQSCDECHYEPILSSSSERSPIPLL